MSTKHPRQPTSINPSQKRSPLMMALEPRIMFDGAAVASAVDAAHVADSVHTSDSHATSLAQPLHVQPQENTPPPIAIAESTAATVSLEAQRVAATHTEIAFIDTSVSGWESLRDGMKDGIEVILIDGSKDGLDQIVKALDGRTNIDAIHILSHGGEGQLQLGSLMLDSTNLDAHAAELAKLGESLTPDGDILLYGCKVAEGDKGGIFIAKLALDTGADIAASTDLTGSSVLGGNWTLEAHTGLVEEHSPLTDSAMDDFSGVLTLVNNGSDGTIGWDAIITNANIAGNATGQTGGQVISVTNLRSSGFDIYVKNDASNSSTNFLLRELTAGMSGGTSAPYVRTNTAIGFTPQWLDLRANEGIFDLTSIKVGSADSLTATTYDFTLQALDSSFNPTGTAVTLSSIAKSNYGTINVASNTDFDGIYGVRITVNTGTQIAVDDIVITTAVFPNAAPVATASGGTTAFTEGNNVTSTPVTIDSSITVTDSDNSTQASATVAITGGLHTSEDVLAFTNNPATMGNITGTYTAGTGIMALSSSGATATLAQWQAALRSVTYTNSSDSPNTTNRTISFTTNDGTSNSAVTTKTVSIAAVDDTPIASASGGTTAFTEGNNVTSTPVAVDSSITLSDLDSTTFSTGTVSITGNLHTAEDVLAFTNNPATMGNITGSYTAGTGILSLSSSGATATKAQWQAALRSITYTNSSDTPNTSNRTISFVVNDGNSSSTATTKTVSVASVNDTPVATASGGNTAFTEGNNTTSTPVVVDSSITVSDLDNTTLASATVAITGNLHNAEDVLAFTNNPATMGNISASYNSSTGIMTLTSSGATANLAQWRAALRSITYTNSSDTPNTSNRTISFTTNDGTADGNTTTKTITIASVNDTPITTASGGTTSASPGTPIAVDNGITISDLDSTTLASATVSITGNLQTGEDVLAFTNNPATMGNISAVYTSGTGVLALTSSGATATLAQWQAALRSVTYNDTSGTPNTSNRTVSFVVNDGSTNSTATTKTLSVGSPLILSNLNTDSVAWAGVGNTVVLDAGANATVSDTVLSALNSGNGDWAGASLTVQRAGTAITSDTLSFNTAGATFTSSGANLLSGAQIFATLTNSGGVLTINFTSSGTTATTALVQDVINRITYRNDTPAGDATVRFSLNNGSNTAIANVTVASDTIYITNTTDTATIDISNGVSFSEAIAIAAADVTGTQTLVFSSSFAGSSVTLAGNVSIGESLTFNADVANGLNISGSSITFGSGTNSTFTTASDTVAITIASTLAGSGNLIKAGNGTLTLSSLGNEANMSGNIIVNGGTLNIGNDDSMSSGTLTLNGGTLSNNATTFTLDNNIVLGAAGGTVHVDGAMTLSGAISGANDLTKTGGGILTLSGTNTYGATNVNQGTLSIASDSNLGSGTVFLDASTLQVTGATTIDNDISLISGATIQLDVATTVSGQLFGSDSLSKTGLGTLTLTNSNNNSMSGEIQIQAGLLSVADGAYLPSVIVLHGGNLHVTAATTVNAVIAVQANGTITTDANVIFAEYFEQTAGTTLTKDGVGTLTLANVINSSYMNGNIAVTVGTLAISNDGNLSTGTLTLNGGNLAITATGTYDNALSLGSNGGTIITSPGVTANWSGGLAGTGILTKAGTGTLTLSGNNAGSTGIALNVTDGTVAASSSNELTGGAITLNGGDLALSTGNFANAINLAAAATINGGSANLTLSGALSGSGQLTKIGTGTLTLNGASSTYTGAIVASTGVLVAANSDALGTAAGGVTVNNGASLRLSNGVTVADALTLNGTGLNNNGALQLLTGTGTVSGNIALATASTINAGAALTISGIVSGSNNLTKTGSGSLTLSSSNTYTGSTTVSAGSLLVTGTLGNTSSITVNSGATLSGTGSLFANGSTNTLSLNSGATLSPGVSGAGTLTVNGNLSMASGSTLAVDISGATAGTQYDQVVVNGTVDVSGVTLLATHSYTAGIGDAYTIITNDGNDAITGTFTGVAEGNTTTASGNSTALTASYIGITGNDFTLTTPVNPVINSISSSTANGGYKAGDTITLTVSFDQAVNVDTTGGTPTLLLETGTIDRAATYVSGSGTTTLSFSYTVQAGDNSADLDYQSTTALALNGGSIRDALSNNANLTLATPGAANSLGANKNIIIDGVASTISSVSVPSNATYITGQNLDFTVNLSENVVVDTTGGTPRIAITLDTGGTVYASYLSGSGTSALVFRATVASGQLDTNGINVGSSINLNGGTLTDTVGNNTVITLNSVGATTGVLVDAVAPTASIVVADNALTAGETSLVTITFSEAVTGFTNGDLSIANGILSAVSSSDGGVTWTASFTPNANITDATNVITINNAGVQDVAGNTGTGTTDSNNYAIDTARPTASIVVADNALAIGETSLVTITFSEAVTGFTNADLSIANGILSAVSSSDGGVTWTATFTPTANITDATNVITLSNTGIQDAAGNTGLSTTDSNNYAIDTARPTASIVVADNALAIGETSLVTITFSEAVTGFTNADLSIANGILSAVSSSDGGVTWTATFTPTANITDATNVITINNAGVQDAAGNTGTGTTDSNNYAIDTARPTASIVVADNALTTGETSLVTITFSEAVTGFTNADLSIANGILSSVSSSDGGVTWTATFTPTANITDSTNVITLSNTGVQDVAGNTGTGTTDSNNYAIDTARPTASIVVADNALAIGETSLVTITFSEAITGFTNADLSIANGILSAVSSSDGGVTWTATFTPTANITDSTNVITINNAGVQDAAGNTGTGTTDSNNYAIDTARPTASIVVADNALAIGETSLVTITFSEAVTGFTNADLSIANGILSAVSSSDGGVTWTATFTPTANITDATNIITLNNTGVQDAAGNTGTGTTDSNNYAIDAARPTASIVVADNALAAGETSLVTITFSEAVTGFTNADLSIANGILSAVSSSDGGVTWTASFTPNANITDATNVITINNAGVQDVAGNTGTGTTDSNNYAIDTARPTASIVVADNALAIGETSLVTITFSEAVTGFTNADLSIANGILSAVSSSDGGVTWTATFTPTANITDATNVITLSNTGVQDAAGNTGTGTTDSNNYAIDTARPTASIVVADNALAIGETSLVTITFSEAVTGFTNADLTIANGTLSSVITSDGGVTWTATFTPTAGITDTTNLITLDNTGVQDTAGNAGTGTTDSNNYVIDALAPTVGSVSVPVGVSYNTGDVLSFTVNTSEVVTVNTIGGTPRLALDIGGTTVYATYAAGSGTNTIVFQYTVHAGDNDANGISVSDLQTNGGTLRDTAGNNLNIALSNIGSTSNVIVDTTAPITNSIVVADTSLIIGKTSVVTITFNEAVTGLDVTDFTVANGTLNGLSSSDGGITWTATLTPTTNITDTTNIITLNNTGLTDIAGNAGTGSTDSNSYAIDTLAPTVSSVSVPIGVPYNAGDVLTFTVNTSEKVLVNTAGGTPRLTLNIGGTTVFANYVAGSNTNTLVFQYTIKAGDNSSISVGSLSANGATLRDAAGNNLNATLSNVGSTAGITVDTTAPTVSSLNLQGTPASYDQTVNFVITFSEAVDHVDLSDLSLSTTGNAAGNLSSLQQINDHSWQVTVNNINGNGTLRVDVKGGTDITDSAGNALASGFNNGASFTAQQLPPPPVSAPITPLVFNTANDARVQTQAPAPLIVLSPDSTSIGAPTNITPLTTVEAPALATVVPIGLSVAGASNTPSSLDTSVPGSDPIGVVTATSTGNIGSVPGSSHLSGSGSYTPTGPGSGPTIERLNTTSDNSLQNMPIVGHVEAQAGVPLYIPLPNSAPNADASQQLSVDVRMHDGKALVPWLRFDPVTGSLSGQAPKGFEGKLQIQVTVRDSKGNSSSSIVELQFSDHSKDSKPVPAKETPAKTKPGASIMGKPGLNDQFALYGKGAHQLETDALLSALNQHSLITLATARKA